MSVPNLLSSLRFFTIFPVPLEKFRNNIGARGSVVLRH
jgi:hypothetical protein